MSLGPGVLIFRARPHVVELASSLTQPRAPPHSINTLSASPMQPQLEKLQRLIACAVFLLCSLK